MKQEEEDKIMKRLYLMRHAKSDWNGYYVSDFERGLNKRGEKAAPMMGKILKEKNIKPDLIVSSPAKRAKITAEIIADKLGYNADKILFVPKIYEASVLDLFEVLHDLPDDVQSVLLVGHNPAMTGLINQISNVNLDNLPTAAVIGIELPTDNWKSIQPRAGKFLFFEYPKKYQH
jgi:phosphohistidine phosphatase